MTELPQSFYDKDLRRSQSSRANIWLAALLAFASGWTLFGLPGAPMHLLRLPEDVPSFGVGLGDIYLLPNGTLSIQRIYYADRMGRYEIEADGTLHKFKAALRAAESPTMRSQRLDPADLQMVEGHTLKVRPSRAYYKQRAEWREKHTKTTRPNFIPARTMEQDAIEQTALKSPLKEPYAIVLVYGINDTQAHFVLPGHTFYEVLDDYCFHDPDLWITTDRLGSLSHIHATDAGGKVDVKVVKTVKLDLGVKADYDSALRYDRQTHELFLLLPTGDRFWFDPETLAQTKHAKLPGQWDREYGQVGFTPSTNDYPGYPQGSGAALTERGYKRLMRLLAVTFIASLIWLGLELTKAWRSTSGRTTAATS